MAQWSSMPYFHRSMEQSEGVGALLWNGAAVSFSDGRLVVEGYPKPSGALVACVLHPSPLQTRGGECHKHHRTQALGGVCFLRMWADTCFRISFGGVHTVRERVRYK
jgi:hypothetical protein